MSSLQPDLQPLASKLLESKFAPIITIATNDEGDQVQALVESNGFHVDGIDWSDIQPWWLVAKQDEEIIGTIQVCPGKPIGRIEMLATKTSLSPLHKAQVAWRLNIAGMTTLKRAGSQLVSSMVSFDNKNVKKMMKKRGWTTMSTGNIMLKRI